MRSLENERCGYVSRYKEAASLAASVMIILRGMEVAENRCENMSRLSAD